jgi:WD40 repeat protein
LTSQEVVIKLGESGEAISSLSFSENGYHMVSCDAENREIKLWDIRKNKIVKSYSLKSGNAVDKVQFDYSGNYIGLTGTSLVVLDAKTMSPVKEEKLKNCGFTSMKFGNLQDEFLLSTTSSGEIIIHS